MSEKYMSLQGMMANLFGGNLEIAKSKDGKATLIQGEIASGVPITAVVRKSHSMGSSIDLNIDGNRIEHVTDEPKFG